MPRPARPQQGSLGGGCAGRPGGGEPLKGSSTVGCSWLAAGRVHNQLLPVPIPPSCSPCLCTRELQGRYIYLSKCIFVNGCPACKDTNLTPYCCPIGGCYCTDDTGEAYWNFDTNDSKYNEKNCDSTKIFPKCKA